MFSIVSIKYIRYTNRKTSFII